MPAVTEFMKDMNEFVKEQKDFNNSVVDFIKEQKEFNKEQKEFNQKVDQRLSALEKDVKQIKLLPTIKKELKNLD